MSVAKKLLEKNLILIDKYNPDFSELENILNFLNQEQHLTIFVAYKQDIDEQFSNTNFIRSSNMNFIRIDLNQHFVKKYFHIASSSKKRKRKVEKFYYKLDILDFVRKNL